MRRVLDWQGAPEGVKKRKALKPVDSALLEQARELLSEELHAMPFEPTPSAQEYFEAWSTIDEHVVYGKRSRLLALLLGSLRNSYAVSSAPCAIVVYSMPCYHPWVRVARSCSALAAKVRGRVERGRCRSFRRTRAAASAPQEFDGSRRQGKRRRRDVREYWVGVRGEGIASTC